MENNNYFRELSRVLRKHNIESGPVENGRLVILLNGQSVGRIEKGAIRCIAPEDLRTAEASEAFQKAVPYLLGELSMKDSRQFRREIEKISKEVFGC